MQNVIVDYKVLERPQAHHLSEDVIALSAKGWEPLGGVSYNATMSRYIQAMVLYKK